MSAWVARAGGRFHRTATTERALAVGAQSISTQYVLGTHQDSVILPVPGRARHSKFRGNPPEQCSDVSALGI
eukprot:9500576-Pyramimonas_sp.AAC.1